MTPSAEGTDVGLFLVDWTGGDAAFESIELAWDDVMFRWFVPLRDAWPEPEAIAIRASEIRSIEPLPSKGLARRALPHWPAIPAPDIGTLADGLTRAVELRSLIALSTIDDEPDTLTIGWPVAFSPDGAALDLDLIDPDAKPCGREIIDIADLTSVMFHSQYLHVLSLVTG